MNVLAVDPGVRKAGVSLWSVGADGPVLLRSATLHAREGKLADAVWRWVGSTPVGLVVVEAMVKYRLQRSKHRDLDRVRLMATKVAREAQRRGAAVRSVTAAEWKGQTPKTVTRARLKAIGLATEAQGHDEVDAIGIGAVLTGALGRGCTKKAPKK